MATTTILITGANQGLGFETARQLSKLPNVHVFVSGRDPARIQEAHAKITTEEGCRALVDKIVIDVRDDESIKAGAAEVESKLRGTALDVLINNCAVSLDAQIPTKGLRKVFDETFSVNVFGAAIMADAFLPLLKKSKENGGARILNISSGLGSITTISDPNWQYKGLGMYLTVYNSSKSALNSVTCTLAMTNPDLHVVCLNPGYNSTAMNNYEGHADPKDGVKIIVDHAVKNIGKSPGYYSNQGELPW